MRQARVSLEAGRGDTGVIEHFQPSPQRFLKLVDPAEQSGRFGQFQGHSRIPSVSSENQTK